MGGATDRDRPEVWAGVECTVNRVGDRYHDQLARGGHEHRPGDIERLAGLGVTAVRYPVLWERHAADPGEWDRTDDRLDRLRRAGVRPILGLVHHGSGPPHTSLTDPAFADGLAAFAARVAARYPWADAYTPVNEPLTTARFAGLYGHWYPHGRDDATFVRCLLTQCRAVVLAMRAVRAVNPAARLIQTEDLGKTHAPPALAYQAHFENARRWLSWDLLCGRVGERHPLAAYLRWSGAPAAEVDWFHRNPCPPDVLGANYYVTSERYLDPRLERYPPAARGGNGRHVYVDTEAVRILPGGTAGAGGVLAEAWERYRRPVAVTEAHLGCTREEQVRWLADVWRAACAARADGADVQAVTAWSVFGAHGWDSLVTEERGSYEPGAFDARADPPRPTAVAALVKQLAGGAEPVHPVLDSPGWWRRSDRLLFPDRPATSDGPAVTPARPILLTGGAGPLGSAFLRACACRGLAVVAPVRDECDITDPASVGAALARLRPWAVVNAAGYGKVDAAEAEAERCRRHNTDGPAGLAAACAGHGLPLVTFSTDLVFDGRSTRPYCEGAAPEPLSVYGAAKAEAERRVLTSHPGALVIRTGPLFGPWDGRNFVAQALRALRTGVPFPAADDLVTTPAYLPDLVSEALNLLIDGECGLWHLAPPDSMSWAGLARAAAHRAGLEYTGVIGRPAHSFRWPAPRPPYSALGTERGVLLPPLADSLTRFARAFDVVLAP
ncbi:sugar nucleotide-binding protein [Gemmata sp. JC673]|uniref:dTDP-4-dehydrorhamnose reductase n=1 Tax=Gemmata algarum TaxID=2975278 RepID=A0ABU5F547_9BACT|nr:sugar nucleotide-binding protein [Gemmata algarum]MDY3561927.1 sugar nucleotide-binding protein [Gemmata algarum]